MCVDPGAARQLVDDLDAAFYLAPQCSDTVHERYLDTASGALARAGYVLRRQARYRHGTLNGSSRLVLERGGERIDQVLPPAADGCLAHGPVGERVVAVIGTEPVAEFACACVQYRTWRLWPSATLPLELRLDRVRLLSGERVFMLDEVGLRALAGDAARLDAFVRDLADDRRLVPAYQTRAMRALWLAGRMPVEPPHTCVDADAPVTRLLARHIDACSTLLDQFQPLALEGLDPEGVHQMRTNIRRLRTLLRVGDALPVTQSGKLARELRRVFRALGAVRDEDVLIEQLMTDLAQVEPAEVELLLAVPRRRRERALRRLRKVLSTARYRRLLDLLRSRLDGLPDGGPSVRAFADRLVPALVAACRPAGRHPSDAALHRLRIGTKQLRYGLELFEDVDNLHFDPSGALRAARRLQDVLGRHQDARLARQRVRVLRDRFPAARHAVAHLRRLAEQRRRTARKRFPKCWRALRAQNRRLLRALG